MYTITQGTKDTISQALNMWVCELEKNLKALKSDQEKGVEIPAAIIGRVEESRAQIQKVLDDFENVFDLNFVCIDDSQYENLIEYHVDELEEIKEI